MPRTKAFNEMNVLRKAMITFWKQGYEKTSVQDLVDSMGIHRRSIYDTFGDKQGLFLKVLDQYEIDLEHMIQQQLQPSMSATEKIETLFVISLAPQEDKPNGCLIVNTATELALLDAEVAAKTQAMFYKSEQFIYQILKTDQEQNSSLNNRNLPDLASYIHNAWIGLRVLSKTTSNQAKLHAIIQLTLSVLSSEAVENNQTEVQLSESSPN